MTQQAVAEGLRALGADLGADAPRVDAIQLGHWEVGHHHPKPAAIALLSRFYACSVGELGFGDAAAAGAMPLVGRVIAPAGSSAAAARGRSAGGGSLGTRVDAARRSVDRTLSASSVSQAQLDVLDERVLWARQQYVYTPPAAMLEILLAHLAEVEDLAADRQPAVVQVRLSELTAMLATLVADALMKLGDLVRSQGWYGTARNAADDSGNTELRARVRAQAAMLPFYYGPLEAAVALSREARMICRARPTPTGAFAAAAEARARARLGDAEGAQAALRHAEESFERTGPAGGDHEAFGFPLRRLLLYKSGTLTALGHTRPARRVQEQALALYPGADATGIDPTLLSFEAAICLARENDPTEACALAGATLLGVAGDHRTPIVEERARDVIATLPPRVRAGRAVRELREIIALPPGRV
ncbi:XRE family transcriptional regulator (plasmid) [Embleya sp. NBC_00888]|uniref:XRE family transcriptional regulator n=1 Tax=Embleya sp. NBC_00888 TaxID=2975960 RepID=UPI002F913AE5|nr:XRE family transcriptional regulator [Embleya sp. NBC_00888]